jgi:hypothetical protein
MTKSAAFCATTNGLTAVIDAKLTDFHPAFWASCSHASLLRHGRCASLSAFPLEAVRPAANADIKLKFRPRLLARADEVIE